MDIADLVLRWIHILSAIVMVGGAFFWWFVWAPTAATLDTETRKSVFEPMRRRWSVVVMLGTLLLLVTGMINAVRIITRYEFVDAHYHILVAVKFGLALLLFFLAARLAGRSPSAAQFRQGGTWLTINLLLAITVVCRAGYMKSVDRVPKSSAMEPVAPTSKVAPTNSNVAATDRGQHG